MPANNVTITATFKAKTPEPPVVTEHTVTFDYKGHGTNTDSKVKHGEKVTAPAPAPTAEGYDFGGWYKDEGLSQTYDFNTAVTGDITLYAKWTAIEYNVTVEKATTTKTKAAKGDSVTITAEAAEAEQEFDKWIVTGIELNETQLKTNSLTITMPASDVSFKATYKTKEYKITVISKQGDGTVEAPAKAKKDDIVEIKITTNDGYKVGTITVTDDNDTSIKVSNANTFTMPASNVTVNVKFEKKSPEDIAADELFKNAKELETIININLEQKISSQDELDSLISKIDKSFNDRIRGTYLEAIVAKKLYNSSSDQTGTNLICTITYHHTNAQEAEVNNYVDNFIRSNITKDMSDYEKIKAVHDYIVTNAAYVALNKIDETTVSIPNTNKYGISVYSPYALSNSENTKNIGVCQAYAGLFQKFMDKLCIKCYYVTGKTTENHAWNIVKLEGKYYNIDLTGDDPVDGNKGITEQNPPKSGLEGYNFFLKSNTTFNSTHVRESLTEINVADEDYPNAATGYLKDQSQN